VGLQDRSLVLASQHLNGGTIAIHEATTRKDQDGVTGIFKQGFVAVPLLRCVCNGCHVQQVNDLEVCIEIAHWNINRC